MMKSMMALALVLAVSGCTRATPQSRDQGSEYKVEPDPPAEAGSVPPADVPHDGASEESSAMTPQATTPDSDIEWYVERLADEHPSQSRAKAEDWLVEHADLSHARMVELVKSREIDLRVMGAFRVLGRMGLAEDVPLLAELASEEPHTSFGWDAGTALAANPSPEATQALLAIAEHKKQGIAGDAIIHLGIRGDESTRAYLEGKLSDARQLIRFKAVRALGEMGPAKSAGALKARLKVEKDDEVRDAIREALAEAKK